MWESLSSLVRSVKKYLFPGKKRKRDELENEHVDTEHRAPKRARKEPTLDRNSEQMNGRSGFPRTSLPSGSLISSGISSSVPNYEDVSDDESEPEISQKDLKPPAPTGRGEHQPATLRKDCKPVRNSENAVDLEARDRYAKLLQQWTPVYRRRLSLSSYKTPGCATEPHKRALRSVLFRQRQPPEPVTATTPVWTNSSGSWLAQAYEKTKANLDFTSASPLAGEAIQPSAGNESGITFDWKQKNAQFQERLFEETSSVGSVQAFDGKFDSLKATAGSESSRSSVALNNQESASSGSLAAAESSSNAALSPAESQSSQLKRWSSLERMDGLCLRSTLADLNGKFMSYDLTPFRLNIARDAEAKVRRRQAVLKLSTEVELRRNARQSVQKQAEDDVRLRMRLEGLLLEERVVKPEFIELTDDHLLVVKRALSPGRMDEVLVEGFNLRLTRHDLQTLSGLNWLNDEVVNFFMNLIVDRGAKGGLPKVYTMNTYFYPKLIQSGHSALKRWTRKVDIFSYDLIMVPVHLGIHWCLAVIDMRSMAILYYDSMGGRNEEGLEALLTYLQDESLEKKKGELDVSNWQLNHVKEIPRQLNGSDCGMFVCRFAECISRDAEITFTQDHMPYFRRRTIYEILTKSLL